MGVGNSCIYILRWLKQLSGTCWRLFTRPLCTCGLVEIRMASVAVETATTLRARDMMKGVGCVVRDRSSLFNCHWYNGQSWRNILGSSVKVRGSRRCEPVDSAIAIFPVKRSDPETGRLSWVSPSMTSRSPDLLCCPSLVMATRLRACNYYCTG